MVKKDQDFEVISGDSRNLNFTIYDQDAADDDSVVKDISGFTTISWKLDTGVASTTVTKSLVSGITITDGANGLLTVALSPSDTASLTHGSYPHELEGTDGSGNKTTLAVGRVSIITDLIT